MRRGKAAITRQDGPSCLVFSRQNLPHQARDETQLANIARGGYVLAEAGNGAPEIILIATGSEVALALGAQEALAKEGLLVGALALITPAVLSAGHGALHRTLVVEGDALPLLGLLLLKATASAISIGAGFRGGLFFASLFMGTLVGALCLAIGGLGMAYLFVPHVTSRIDRFLTGEGDTFQTDTAREAIMRGGWFGQGPGEGTVKRILPDSHTDFAFAVIAEEFGIITCMLLAAVFCFIVVRGLSVAYQQRDVFSRLAISGLVTLFGMQSIINMAVNLQLMPAKGMTLPFLSYGGSSMMAVAISAGFVLALTRSRADNHSLTDRLMERSMAMRPV